MREFIAEDSNSGARADVFVAAQYPDFTRSSLKTLFDQKLVLINGQIAKPSQPIKPTDKVAVDEQLLSLEAPEINLPVLYEDDDVVVIDKPTGVLTHSKGALNPEGTVASFISPKVKGLKGNRAGIVHRLDRPTSGVIIAAKNEPTAKYLQKQFAERKTQKTYLAIVKGVPSLAEGLIDIPIARNPRSPRSFMASSSGKPAQTKYKVLETLGDGKYSLVELKPITGRTHQLRVHLAHLGHPVAGDHLYGKANDGRLMLHARELTVRQPSGELKTFEAAVPADFRL